ncbi:MULTISPECIES: GntR family transcriptional regulator [unclassified Paraburkholderia]|uniref:GntR family transcriptional regulator n=1 Tax=unclassified Paraburkholderia TaxID=2615204 RepID=UPI00286F4034|nr:MULTISPECIES: GntR family transcriptional regulator [unclassified Paraburkholderia]
MNARWLDAPDKRAGRDARERREVRNEDETSVSKDGRDEAQAGSRAQSQAQWGGASSLSAATTPIAPIALLRQHSLTDLVRDEIERCIAGGQLEPGAKLVEAEWAARLQVSRGPVREAFRALEQAGLVRNEKHRGVFVRSVSDAEAGELAALCTVLEEAACRTLAARIDAAQVADLRARLDLMRDTLAHIDDDTHYARAREAFRDALVAAAGNGKLHEAYRRAVREWRLSPRDALTDAARERSYARHRAILNALASRDAEEAAALMRAQDEFV